MANNAITVLFIWFVNKQTCRLRISVTKTNERLLNRWCQARHDLKHQQTLYCGCYLCRDGSGNWDVEPLVMVKLLDNHSKQEIKGDLSTFITFKRSMIMCLNKHPSLICWSIPIVVNNRINMWTLYLECTLNF